MLAVALAVAALTFLAFTPSLQGGWVDWDDAAVRRVEETSGAADLLRLTFADPGLAPVWVPATWLSLRLDAWVLGPGPFGHLLVNALLHAVNAALLLLLGIRLAGAVGEGGVAGVRAAPAGRTLVAVALGALAWSLHPLRVESVSWIVERKDVLMGAFSLLATLAWLRHAAGDGARRWYWAAGALHACALAAKPTAVVLPLAWLLLDAWPLRRLPAGFRTLLVEKSPMLLASAAVGVVTVSFAQSAVEPLHRLAPPGRLLLALGALFEYLRQTIWPAGLHGFRPLDLHEPLWTTVRVARAGGTLVVAIGLISLARRLPAVAAAGALFLVLLLPNHALQSGPQELADRFTYLAAMPLSLLAGAGVGRLAGARFGAAWKLAALGGLAALAAATARQQVHWRDAEALWSRNVELEPRSGFSWARLSRAHLEKGDLDGAIAASEQAVRLAGEKGYAALPRLRGDLAFLFATRARAREASGRREEALADLERAIGLVPAAELLDLRARWRGGPEAPRPSPVEPGAKP